MDQISNLVQSNNQSSTASPTPIVGLSRLATIADATRSVLHGLSDSDLKDHSLVEQMVLKECQSRIRTENVFREKGDKWRSIDALLPSQIADIIAYSYNVVRVVTTSNSKVDTDADLVAFYQDSGEDEGIYSASADFFASVVRSYNYALSSKDVNEVMFALKPLIPRVFACRERNLVAVNNGIFDYDTKTLMPFDPKYVFLVKSRVNYNPNATNVVIHNSDDGTDWDVESWMKCLSDDPEIVDLLWQILGAIIRCNVPWDKSAWFYSESGNNGKGTLCVLMKALCGEGSYASISLSDFSKDFMLEPLIHAQAIIVDENDVGTYIDKAANLKAVITGDTIMVNRKYKTPVIINFRGFMVQCLNEMPRIRDRSDSFFRRQLFVPFTKTFTGAERKYIKNDYLKRKEVLEYVLLKVLRDTNYYELTIPASCLDALEMYKEFVDPVRAFLMEMMPQFKWDLLPYKFLYDLYVVWYRNISGGDRNVRGRPSFIKDVQRLVQEQYPAWGFTDKIPIRPGSRMDDAEPLIAEYDLKEWMEPKYISSKDVNAKCHPVLADKYRGVYRLVRQVGSDDDVAEASDTMVVLNE